MFLEESDGLSRKGFYRGHEVLPARNNFDRSFKEEEAAKLIFGLGWYLLTGGQDAVARAHLHRHVAMHVLNELVWA